MKTDRTVIQYGHDVDMTRVEFEATRWGSDGTWASVGSLYIYLFPIRCSRNGDVVPHLRSSMHRKSSLTFRRMCASLDRELFHVQLPRVPPLARVSY